MGMGMECGCDIIWEKEDEEKKEEVWKEWEE